MKKYLYIVLLAGVCFAQTSLNNIAYCTLVMDSSPSINKIDLDSSSIDTILSGSILHDITEDQSAMLIARVNESNNPTSSPMILYNFDDFNDTLNMTGLNARFTPVFDVIRDPLVPQVADPGDVVQVYDLIGLQITGYIDGKPYYGNVFYDKGIKYAGIRNTGVRVYESIQESITKEVLPVAPQQVQPQSAPEEDTTEISEPVTDDLTVERAETRQTTVPTQNVPTTTTTTTTSTTSPSPSPSPSPSSGGGSYG